MSLLNIANDGYFNVLVSISKLLLERGPTRKDDVLGLCAPAPTIDGSKVRQTVNRWVQLGLLTEEDEVLKFATGFEPISPEDLPRQVRRVVFLKANNENFWDNEKCFAADLTRGLAFLLAQDIYETSISRRSDIEGLEAAQFRSKDSLLLQNDVRWNGLRSWGRYLGFIEELDKPWIDPSRAIHEELPTVFDGAKMLPASEFVDRVGRVLPVLDRGIYRLKVEQSLDERNWRKQDVEQQVSTALSRAIFRLEKLGALKRRQRSDTRDRLILSRAGGERWLAFTDIEIGAE